MTMAFAVVALAGVNIGLVMRREREPWWSAPLFPYMGWVMLGWFLTLLAVAALVVPGFHVDNLLWAILGALVVGLVSWFVAAVSGQERVEP